MAKGLTFWLWTLKARGSGWSPSQFKNKIYSMKKEKEHEKAGGGEEILSTDAENLRIQGSPPRVHFSRFPRNVPN